MLVAGEVGLDFASVLFIDFVVDQKKRKMLFAIDNIMASTRCWKRFRFANVVQRFCWRLQGATFGCPSTTGALCLGLSLISSPFAPVNKAEDRIAYELSS